ncbi:hypothetical protein CAL14_03245 [Bordetella genomosp. 9]|nr:hypothetical protein CAL14_03245 [Bordetella genomosp. 9]
MVKVRPALLARARPASQRPPHPESLARTRRDPLGKPTSLPLAAAQPAPLARAQPRPLARTQPGVPEPGSHGAGREPAGKARGAQGAGVRRQWSPRSLLTMPLLAMPLLMLDAAAPAEAGRDGERRRFILKSRLDVPVQQPGGQMTISYDMSGPGSLRKSGPGLLRLTGANTYTGGTIVERGILRIGDGYAQGSVAGHILNHDLVEFDHDADTVFDGRISGNGGVYFIGAGKTTLTADQHYTGPTAIGDGALQLGNGGVAGSVAGPVHNHNTLIFNRRDAVQMRAGIHGPGRIVHAGSGSTVLLAANTYSGMTDVRRGTLIVNGDQHAATGAVVVRKGAALGGEGTLGGPVRIDDGGTLLAPDATRTLSMPSLTLSPGATVRLPVTDGDAHDGAESPPRIDVDGDVVLDGALDIAGQDAAAYRRGIHRLMRYRGQLTDRTMEIRAVPAGTRASDWSIRTSRSGRIDVVHTAAGPLLIWEGRDPQADGGDGAWTPGRNGTQPPLPPAKDGGKGGWDAAHAAGHAPAAEGAGGWTDGAYAVFDGQPGTVEIASRDAPVTFSGAQFATDGYRLTGPGVLKATAALTPLRVGDGVSGSETMRATIEAAIEGPAILMKTGRGTLQLGGANRHTGGVLLQEGILEIGDDRNLGAPRAPLTFAGGALRTTGDVDSGRPIRLGAQGGLIDTGGRIVRWRGPLTGDGALTKTGAGTLELAGSNTAAGTLAIMEGAVRAGTDDALGAGMQYRIAQDAVLDTGGRPQTIAALVNAGTIRLQGTQPGNTLTVQGDYVGLNGELHLTTVLGSSGSATDRLVIDGGRAAGHTRVTVANAGGLGAATDGDGIEVVRAVNGATTTAQTTRDAFVLTEGHVAAGAFEYRLFPGDAQGNGESWYLRSTLPRADPRFPAGSGRTAYRPEIALHAALPAVLAHADLAVLAGAQRGRDDAEAPRHSDTGASRRRAWAHVLDERAHIRQRGTVSPRSRGSVTGAVAGADIYAGQQVSMGIYGGTLAWRHHVHGDVSGMRGADAGRLHGRGHYAGAYWIRTNEAGAYASVVAQHGRQRGKTETAGVATAAPGIAGLPGPRGANVRARSTLVSVEAGVPLPVGIGWRAEPQIQAVVIHRHFDDVALPAATVRQRPGTAVMGRIGVRVTAEDIGAAGLRPYARANLWHALHGADVQRVRGPAGSARIAAQRGHTAVELSAGASWRLNRNVELYGEAGGMAPAGGAQRVSVQRAMAAGIRVVW